MCWTEWCKRAASLRGLTVLAPRAGQNVRIGRVRLCFPERVCHRGCPRGEKGNCPMRRMRSTRCFAPHMERRSTLWALNRPPIGMAPVQDQILPKGLCVCPPPPPPPKGLKTQPPKHPQHVPHALNCSWAQNSPDKFERHAWPPQPFWGQMSKKNVGRPFAQQVSFPATNA